MASPVPDPLKYKNGRAKEVLAEMEEAERNVDSIWEVGEDLAIRSFLATYSSGVRIQPLRDLVKFLKQVFSTIRRKIEQKGGAGLEGALPSHTGFNSLCPLTVLLQAIALSLSEVRIRVGPNVWGNIDPLRRNLERLQANFHYNPARRFHPGVAKCIISHEEHGKFTVTSTSPAYRFFDGLEKFGKWVRYRYISRLKDRVSWEKRHQISRRLEYSNKLIQSYNTPEGQQIQAWDQKFHQRNATRVGGNGATFNWEAVYKVVCVVDFCRFNMDRNQRGNYLEYQVAPKARGPNSGEACAEWKLWLVKLGEDPVSVSVDLSL